MEKFSDIPFCPIPSETVSDVIPMLVIAGVFLLAGWLIRRSRKRRKARRSSD